MCMLHECDYRYSFPLSDGISDLKKRSRVEIVDYREHHTTSIKAFYHRSAIATFLGSLMSPKNPTSSFGEKTVSPCSSRHRLVSSRNHTSGSVTNGPAR